MKLDTVSENSKKIGNPLTPAQRQKAKRERAAASHARLGGREKRIHIYQATMKAIDSIQSCMGYVCEDEAIVDAIAVAAEIAKSDASLFNEMLQNSRHLDAKREMDRRSEQVQADPSWVKMDPSWVVDFIRDESKFDADKIEQMLQFAVDAAKSTGYLVK